jgi:hypothetical protein
VPLVHMPCRMTASLRATAIDAFLVPMRLPRASPQNTLGRAPIVAHFRARSEQRESRAALWPMRWLPASINLAAPHDLVGIVDDTDRRFPLIIHRGQHTACSGTWSRSYGVEGGPACTGSRYPAITPCPDLNFPRRRAQPQPNRESAGPP